MAHLSEADRYLLEQVSRGQADAWAQLVQRYQGRLLAFARGRLGSRADAEDLVQETFLAFLQSPPDPSRGTSIETYLFVILRRRMVDRFRARHLSPCSLQEAMAGTGEPAGLPVASPDLTASGYARRSEQSEQWAGALSAALDELIGRLRSEEEFDRIHVVELLFYAQLRNKDVARLVGADEKQVAGMKFRYLAELRDRACAGCPPPAGAGEPGDGGDSLLTRVWEKLRPTCPKRSTLGRYLLGTLEPAWHQHVRFHLEQLGCRFCLANLEDIKPQENAAIGPLHSRILQSTAGFLRRS